MIALYIVGGILLLLILLLFLRIGVEIAWGESTQIWARVGFVRKQLMSKQDKPPKKKKEKRKKEKTSAAAENQPKPKKKFKPTFEDIKALFPAAKESLQKGLRKTRQRVKIDPLEVSVTFGGADPAEVAEQYGWANAAMWAVMPEVERLTRMPEPRIHLDMNYDVEKTATRGKAGLSLQIRDALAIAVAFGLPLYRWYRQAAKAQKTRGTKTTDVSIERTDDHGTE